MRIMPVDESNYRQILQLKVLPNQQDFIENIVECLENAENDKGANMRKVVGIYDEATLVGFGMYGFLQEAGTMGRAWLENFMIDSSYQGHGYGERALNLLVAAMENDYGHKSGEIYLSVNPLNSRAIGLYKHHGFEFNGEINQYSELIMVKKLFSHDLVMPAGVNAGAELAAASI